MLPKTLYKSLPYLYIVAGASGSVLIESQLVFLGSTLLMAVGLIVLWLRSRSPKHEGSEPELEIHDVKARNWNDIFQAEQERRLIGAVRAFPLIDNSGNLIAFDRRVGARRVSGAA